MQDQKLKSYEQGKLSPNVFLRYGYHFDHWDGSDGKTYEDGAVIPADTFEAEYILTLTAVFEKNTLSFTDGEADIYIPGGAKAVLPALPGGASYQVWEETPSGWQLTDQTNTAGNILPNETINASFTNEYVPGTATICLLAQKTLDGRAPGADQFAFELLDENNVLQTASNNAAGMVLFDQLVFRQPGTFTYKIREVRGDDAAISYDSHTETVTITVSDDGQGNLTAVSSQGTDIPVFANETKPGALTVTKLAEGAAGDEVFTFEISLTNEYGQPLDDVNIITYN